MPAERTIETRVDHCVAPGCIERIHDALVGLWERAPDVPGLDRMLFETAVVEVAANLVEHSVRGPDFDAHVVLRVRGNTLEAELSDTGLPVEVDLDVELPEDDLATNGRGLPLARRAVHELRYLRRAERNHWYLVRRWEP